MHTKIQHVFRTVQPYRLLLDLGIPMTEENGSFFTVNPARPEIKMMVGEQEFVSLKDNSEFFAGDAFRYLAHHFKGDYEKVVDYLVERYGSVADNQSEYSLQQLRSVYIDDLRQRDLLFNSIFRLRLNVIEHATAFKEARAWLRGKLIEPETCYRALYAATGVELKKLLNFTGDTAEPAQFNDADTYVVFPYFKNFGAYSSLKIHSIRDNSIQSVTIDSVKCAYLGLHTCDPRGLDVRIFREALQAISIYSTLAEHGKRKFGCVHLAFNASNEHPPALFNSATYTTNPDHHEFPHMVRSRLQFRDFSVAEISANSANFGDLPSMTWDAYLCRKLQHILNKSKRRYSPGLQAFIDELRPDRGALEMLQRSLKEARYSDLAEYFKAASSDFKFWTFDRLVIRETPDGYSAEKTGTPGRQMFTNFIVRIDRTVWFDRSKDIYHVGRVIMQGKEYPIWISRKSIDKSAEIGYLVQDAVMAASRGQDVLPMITDTTYRGRLSSVLKAQDITAKNLTGIERLGWDTQRGTFTAPRWMCNSFSIAPTSMLLHPASSLSKIYGFAEYAQATETDLITSEHRSYLAILVAMLARSYAGLVTPIVRLTHTEDSQRLLLALFNVLGQRQILEINPNRRGGLPVLDNTLFSGYPLFGTCANESVLSETNYPLFLLSKSGLPVSHSISDAAFIQLYSYTQHIIQTSVLQISREKIGFGATLTPDIPTVPELINEGRRLIEKFTNAQFDVFELDMPYFRSMLSEIPFDQVHRFFRFDIEAQRIFINFRPLDSYHRKDVLPDILKRDPTASMHQDHYIAADPTVMNELLTTFYGHLPAMRQEPAIVGLPPVSGEAAQRVIS